MTDNRTIANVVKPWSMASMLEAPGISLRDGDIVLVSTSGIKAVFVGFRCGSTGIFNVGYGVQGL